MQARRLHPLVIAGTSLLATLVGCSSDSSSKDKKDSVPQTVLNEQEPNDDSTTALALPLTRPAMGDVTTAGDVDFWKVQLKAGKIVSIAIRACQFDFDTWNTNGNVPRLTLYAEDGTTKVVEQDSDGNFSDGWSWHWGDLDIPSFYIETGGTYYVAVTQDQTSTDGGAYVLEVNEVSGFGTIHHELEDAGNPNSNDTSGTAETITAGTWLGYHDAGESDWYQFTITAPTYVRFQTYSYRNGAQEGGDYVDPEIWLYDTDGSTELFSNNDDYFYDSGLDYLLDTAGTYFIEVNDDGSPQGPGQYLMNLKLTTVGTPVDEVEPNESTSTGTLLTYGQSGFGNVAFGELDCWSFEGTAGDMVHITVYDRNGGPFDGYLDVDMEDSNSDPVDYEWYYNSFNTVNTILQADGTFGFFVVNNDSDSDYVVRIDKVSSSTYETEPNDSQAEQQAFSGRSRFAGVIGTSGDVDMYSFQGKANQVYEFSCYAGIWEGMASDYQGFGSEMYPTLTIYDANGDPIAWSSDDSVSSENLMHPEATTNLTFVAPANGTYTIEVSDQYGDFGSDIYYVLERH